MPYNKQTWNTYDESKTEQQNIANGAVVTSERMNHIEAGIEEASESGGGQGLPGKSAYEIAVDNGFVGTEQEWLASLEGAPGEDGDPGIPGQAATIEVGSVTVDNSATKPTIENSGDETQAIFDFTFPPFGGGGGGVDGYKVVDLDLSTVTTQSNLNTVVNNTLLDLGYSQTAVLTNSYHVSVNSSTGNVSDVSVAPLNFIANEKYSAVLLLKENSPMFLFMAGFYYSNTPSFFGMAVGDKDLSSIRVFKVPERPINSTNITNLKTYLLNQMPAASTVNAYAIPATTSAEELNTAINTALISAAQAQTITLQQAQNKKNSDEGVQSNDATIAIPYYDQTELSVINEQLSFDSVSGDFSISDVSVDVTDGGQLLVNSDGPLTLILKSDTHQGTYIANGNQSVDGTREFRKKAESLDALNNLMSYLNATE